MRRRGALALILAAVVAACGGGGVEASPDAAPDAVAPDAAPTPEQASIERSERGRIEGCLDALEPDKADCVRGAYLDGFSYEELAVRHKVPLNTMRTWLRRSLIKLRECLSA